MINKNENTANISLPNCNFEHEHLATGSQNTIIYKSLSQISIQ
ncbi:hypothetical protein EV13_1758 [Prochlorococcus sp. MIT 0702]|nr:hypothetical protein EV12_1505 [Prochlorococcus sp. MIT 0701]KGG27865.1 hypothetical protein EV13_1758 [Prochlorococcus sp. MIT 0702]KGG31412.1 hypothetical protein EV14_2363 [Prochlorococcus sp. MIT 0703]